MPSIEIRSEITGKVWKVEASPGDQLQEDDIILILESMKMEIPIEAGHKGTLTEVLVKEDEQVEEDQLVAILDAGDS